MDCSLELVTDRDNRAIIKLSGTLDFNSVVSMAEDTGSLFQDYENIDIDLSGISYINSAGLALLLNWKQQAESAKTNLQITGIPKKLLDIASISELEPILF